MVGMRHASRREQSVSVRKIPKKISAVFLSGVFFNILLSMLIPTRRISSTTATRIPFSALATTVMVMAFCRKAEIKSSTRKEGSTMPRVAVNAPFIPACLSPVQSMVKIKNQIHGMMLGYGIETKAAQFQSKKKRQELMNDLADHEYSAFTASSLKVMLQIIDDLSEEIKRVEAQLVEMVKENEDVELLMSIPGVGINTATTIAAYTENLERFDGNYKRFASYIGIVPSVHNSNETKHLGRITKHGPQELRTAFVPAALGMVRLTKVTSEWRLIKDYHRKKDDKGSGRAIIALARKISRIVFVMLSKREAFNPDLMRLNEQNFQQTA